MNQSKSKGKKNQSDSRRGYPRRLGSLLPPEARKALRKFGFADADIITKWKAIAGQRFGDRTVPTRLIYPRGERRGGTLHLMVDSGFAVELQHIEPLLIERINSYYGYAAVEKLVIQQGFLPRAAPTNDEESIPLSKQHQKEIASIRETTRNDELKAALVRLGERVMASEEKKRGR